MRIVENPSIRERRPVFWKMLDIYIEYYNHYCFGDREVISIGEDSFLINVGGSPDKEVGEKLFCPNHLTKAFLKEFEKEVQEGIKMLEDGFYIWNPKKQQAPA